MSLILNEAFNEDIDSPGEFSHKDYVDLMTRWFLLDDHGFEDSFKNESKKQEAIKQCEKCLEVLKNITEKDFNISSAIEDLEDKDYDAIYKEASKKYK